MKNRIASTLATPLLLALAVLSGGCAITGPQADGGEPVSSVPS